MWTKLQCFQIIPFFFSSYKNAVIDHHHHHRQMVFTRSPSYCQSSFWSFGRIGLRCCSLQSTLYWGILSRGGRYLGELRYMLGMLGSRVSPIDISLKLFLPVLIVFCLPWTIFFVWLLRSRVVLKAVIDVWLLLMWNNFFLLNYFLTSKSKPWYKLCR